MGKYQLEVLIITRLTDYSDRRLLFARCPANPLFLFCSIHLLLRHLPSSIRAAQTNSFPQINIGSTDDSVEIVVFAPGIDPSKVEVTVDKGLLTISGERRRQPPSEEARPYAQERFSGSFRRAIELPRDADPDRVQARFQNGCLSISVGRRETTKPRTIAIQ